MKYLTCLIIVVSPFPFGSARPIWEWSWVLLIATFSSTSLYLTKKQSRLAVYETSHPLALPGVLCSFLLFITFLGWLCIQAMTLSTNDMFAGRWPGEFATPEYNGAGLATAAYFASHIVFFFSLLAHLRGRGDCEKVLYLFMVSSTCYSLYGLMLHFAGSDTILWFKRWSGHDSVSATFVNRNNFATYAGLGLLTASATIIRDWSSIVRPRNNLKLATFQIIERVASHSWINIVCLFILLSSLILSGSRAGVISTISGCLVFYSVIIYKKSHGFRLARFALFISLLLTVLSISGGLLLARFSLLDSTVNYRTLVYTIVVKAIETNPLTGFGAGRFSEVFAAMRTPEIPAWFDRAHNDYLELAFTVGVPATIVFLGAFLPIVRLLVTATTGARNSEPYIVLGIGATVLVGIHSMFDFSMQIPAVSYCYVIVLAVALIQASTHLAE